MERREACLVNYDWDTGVDAECEGRRERMRCFLESAWVLEGLERSIKIATLLWCHREKLRYLLIYTSVKVSWQGLGAALGHLRARLGGCMYSE